MSTQNQTPQPVATPENTPERHLHVVPDLPSESRPLHGPYTDAQETAKMPLSDIADVPEENLDQDLLRKAKATKANSIGKMSLEFYYREKSREESNPGYRYI